MKQPQQVTEGQADVLISIAKGNDTKQKIMDDTGKQHNSVYGHLYSLQKLLVTQYINGKWRIVNENYTIKTMKDDPKCPFITNMQNEVLQVVLGSDANSTDTIANTNIDLTRSSITHGLGVLYDKKILSRVENPKGKFSRYGYIYTYTGLPYKIGARTGGRNAVESKDVTYAACDMLICRKVA